MFNANVNRTSLDGNEMRVSVCQILGITELWNSPLLLCYLVKKKKGRKRLLTVDFGTISPTFESIILFVILLLEHL